MDLYKKCFIIYLVIINLLSIIITIKDKRSAIKQKWRVKENSLFLLSIFGGGIGMYITMHIIRHKTKHFKFMFGIPFIILLEAALFVGIYFW